MESKPKPTVKVVRVSLRFGSSTSNTTIPIEPSCTGYKFKQQHPDGSKTYKFCYINASSGGSVNLDVFEASAFLRKENNCGRCVKAI
jgi:hypothetical protein